MKQRITVEQWKELSLKAREKLREWWKPQQYGYDVFLEVKYHKIHGEWIPTKGSYYKVEVIDEDNADYYSFPYEIKEYCGGQWRMYPLLSIGQMIEFLSGFIRTDGRMSIVDNMFNVAVGDGHTCVVAWDTNLCDALWEEVKEVLEQKEDK
jgi:hypothetical protein